MSLQVYFNILKLRIKEQLSIQSVKSEAHETKLFWWGGEEGKERGEER